jgi:pimeloyl-ACP methyl ester carboxylesterase
MSVSGGLAGVPFKRLRPLLVGAAALWLTAGAAIAQPAPRFATPGACTETPLPGGARAMTCVPKQGWNGSLVVFAHGYLSPFVSPAFAHLQLSDGTSLPELVQKLGFAFATTTYRQSGLAILEGVKDIIELVQLATRTEGVVRTYVTGVSEGGLVAVLAAEQRPELFEAAFATCAPIGNFLFHVNYVGDFRVLFDVFFPGVIDGSAVDVPAAVVANWDTIYVPRIANALRNHRARARELFQVARVPYDPADATGLEESALALLWQNVMGARDAREKLGGNPYGNRLRWYSGSTNDMTLNLRVRRVDADVSALLKVQQFSPTGDLRIPLVTLHTTGDAVVPYAHELLYAAKVRPSNRGRLLPLPVLRAGHCAFSTSEVLTGFALMLGAGSASAPVDGRLARTEPLVRNAPAMFVLR